MADQTELKKYKTFFVWGEEKEAAWLNRMGKEGWLLKSANFFCYTFEKRTPGDYIYQFDFRTSLSGDESEYLELFESAGWTFVHKFGAWYYFRKLNTPGELNRIYSDRSSLVEKYKKVLRFLLLVALPLFYNFFIIARKDDISDFYRYFWVFNTVILGLWLYAFVRILLYIRKIKREDL